MKAAEPLLVALAEQSVEAFAEGTPLPFVRVGEHSFTDYGDVHITDDDLDRIVSNFRANARRGDLPIVNEEHIPAVYDSAGEVQMGPGAIGWVTEMYRDGDTVFFVPDWNPAGERLLADDRYRGVSPELLLNWTDPETGEAWGLTAAGVALTNKPRMKSLAFQGQPIADTPAPPRVLAYSEHASAPDVEAAPAAAGAALEMADGDAGGKVDCPTCDGSGTIMGGKRDCPDCDGSGRVTSAQAAKLKGAEMSSASQNDLPDSAFAHVESGGEKDDSGKTTPRSLRHYPVHDKAHADNAAARAAQQIDKGGKAADIARAALPKIRAAQKRFGSKAASELADVHADKPLPHFSVAYAYPQVKRLPLMTAEQVKGARARFLSIDAAEDERDRAWGEIRRAAEEHGVSVPASWRELNASECARALMQERLDMNGEGMASDTAEDIAAGQLAPCTWQPPFSEYGRCPGFTRDDPDNDGDSDCCAMAGKGCNGYQPVVPIQPAGGAIYGPPQSPTYYRERERPGGSMTRSTSTANEEVATPVKTSEPAPEPVVESPAAPPPAPAPEATTPPAPAPAEPVAPAPAPAVAVTATEPSTQLGADLSEVQSILAAERHEREALAARLKAAEANVQTEREARLRMETAARMAEIAGRVEGLVRTGRITPAQRELLMKDPARFSEDDHLLAVLEAAPANSVVDMRERGTGTEENQPESHRLEAAAKALMAERQQSTSPNDPKFFQNYKSALLEVGRVGYRTR